MDRQYRFLVTAAKGIVPLLREELHKLGIPDLVESNSGIGFTGSLTQAYQVCLWSRLGSRVLLCLDRFPCCSSESLYQGIMGIDWSRHMPADSSFAVHFSGTSAALRNSHFAALKAKDAIVDQFRQSCGERPKVELEQPDLQIRMILKRQTVRVYLDLSGEGLHKRGYRIRGGRAPLKENLAAAVLIRAKWPEIAGQGTAFLDPMCGSATLLIEAAMIAGDFAPGLGRKYFGFLGWRGHDAVVWAELVEQAELRRQRAAGSLPPFTGYDINHHVLRIAEENIANAGFEHAIHLERRPVSDARSLSTTHEPGLIATNPPYGERLDSGEDLRAVYAELGSVLKSHFVGWRVAVLIQDQELGFRIGIRSRRPYTLYNGAIECKLLSFRVDPERFFDPKGSSRENSDGPQNSRLQPLVDRARMLSAADRAGSEMLFNRLRKNLRKLKSWIKREQISCYRLYDADIPEYAMAIDIYQGQSRWVHVQEYQAPRDIDHEKAESRLIAAISVLQELLEIDWENIFVKVRRRQKGNRQYQRQPDTGNFQEVNEGGYRFRVNFSSYLDTGLFLDQRITRRYISKNAENRRFLNLFGYTGSATVYAAAGGAASTTTVDLSRTYLDWTRDNLRLNGLDPAQHILIQADILTWLEQSWRSGKLERSFDLIFLDPPTYSNSKSMSKSFDIQRDHADLIRLTVRLLAANGLLLFSTNFRKFKLEKNRLRGLNIVDISRQTLPPDFARNPKIHQVWEIRRQ